MAYAGRLMAVLEFASVQGWELKVVEGQFLVLVPGSSWGEFKLSHTHHEPDSCTDLVMLEQAVAEEQARQREYERKQALRASAREKLTEEERQAVGL